MAEREEKTGGHAADAAGKEEIGLFVHDPSPSVLRALLGNGNLTEEDVLIIANRNNLTGDILEMIAKDKRWTENYPIRLALVRNPRAPLSVSLSIARFLRIFDLEEITRNPFIPSVLRHKIEAMIIERIPAMPSGNKKTLAKKAAGNVLLKLLRDRNPEVVRLCLNNPRLIENHLYKVLSRTDTSLETIMMIAEHPNWSCRPLVRFSITRNPLTPLAVADHFLKNMKVSELQDLYLDPSLPPAVKPCVHRALLLRGRNPQEAVEAPVYEIKEEEMADIDCTLTLYEREALEGVREERNEMNDE